MKVIVINGPNLNALGKRDESYYGAKSLKEIEAFLQEKAIELELDVEFFQSNHEGAIIDHLQGIDEKVSGIVINAGALTHYGLSLRDALADLRLPVVEVHISNIHAREEFRHNSVISPISVGQIVGLGWAGYVFAIEYLASYFETEGKR